jgi:hypothetical protein
MRLLFTLGFSICSCFSYGQTKVIHDSIISNKLAGIDTVFEKNNTQFYSLDSNNYPFILLLNGPRTSSWGGKSGQENKFDTLTSSGSLTIFRYDGSYAERGWYRTWQLMDGLSYAYYSENKIDNIKTYKAGEYIENVDLDNY